MRVSIAFLFSLAFAVPALAETERPDIVAIPVAGGTESGPVAFAGGLELRSDDPEFGGWSAMVANADLSEAILVSDRARILPIRLTFDWAGRPAGLAAEAPIRPLLEATGEAIALTDCIGARCRHDAEALAVSANGDWLVAFEHRHRPERYEAGGRGKARTEAAPAALDALGAAWANAGAEALAIDRSGRLVMILEAPDGSSETPLFIREPGSVAWQETRLPLDGGFRVTDAAFLANGDLLLLERYWDGRQSNARLRRLSAAALEGSGDMPVVLAEMRGLLPDAALDNYEALAVGSSVDGRTPLLIASDDNFNRGRQKSLLMLLILTED